MDKGIVYDTGGLSIKTSGSMAGGMKRDMGGTAAIVGAFEAAVKSGIYLRPLLAVRFTHCAAAGNSSHVRE